MKRKLIEYSTQQGLLDRGDRVLVCTSGGVDSMVLLDILRQVSAGMGLEIAVAHCNFNLRAEESDADQTLVEEYCTTHQITLHTVSFDTKSHATQHKQSTQMAARNLRYEYFETLATQHNYHKIAIAHNAQDSTETLLINLTRGTGLKGLCGIKPQNQKIVRPLGFSSRSDIEKYAQQNHTLYRTDKSNFDTQKYLRSKIRHKIIPQLTETNPSFHKTMAENIHRLNLALDLLEHTTRELKESVCTMDKVGGATIDMEVLRHTPGGEHILFEVLEQYGFKGGIIPKIYAITHPGKQFQSETHTLTVDRNRLIICKIDNRTACCEKMLQKNDPLIKWINPNDFNPREDNAQLCATLCADNLEFPLTLRKWENGDKITPLGMTNDKKISDILIDAKTPQPLKEKQLVLCQKSGEIIWAPGHRISNNHKITPNSKTAFRIKLDPIQ